METNQAASETEQQWNFRRWVSLSNIPGLNPMRLSVIHDYKPGQGTLSFIKNNLPAPVVFKPLLAESAVGEARRLFGFMNANKTADIVIDATERDLSHEQLALIKAAATDGQLSLNTMSEQSYFKFEGRIVLVSRTEQHPSIVNRGFLVIG